MTRTILTLLIALALTLVIPRQVLAAGGPTDDPYFEELAERPTPATPIAPVILRPKARWADRPETQLTISAGWTFITGLTLLSAPSLQANLTLRSTGISERLGLRISGFYAIEHFGADQTWSDATESASYAMGLNLAVEISWRGGFYIAPGLGIYHYRGELKTLFNAPEKKPSHDDEDNLTVPELTLAVGWQWELSRHLALQFNAQAGTALVTLRCSLMVGLVWRL
ncbi:MAG: hypothetical protein CSA65_00970 [Proteobacteria bacterium]|nr:MAG: hypothetical protein CSA65_00970 [Pseudomonadota bacterium]